MKNEIKDMQEIYTLYAQHKTFKKSVVEMTPQCSISVSKMSPYHPQKIWVEIPNFIQYENYNTLQQFYFTPLPSTIVLLHSTRLYITLPWLYFTLHYSTKVLLRATLHYITLP